MNFYRCHGRERGSVRGFHGRSSLIPLGAKQTRPLPAGHTCSGEKTQQENKQTKKPRGGASVRRSETLRGRTEK